MAMENEEKVVKKVKSKTEGAAEAVKKAAAPAAQTVKKVVKKAETSASDGKTVPESKPIAKKPAAAANAAPSAAKAGESQQSAEDAPKKKKMTVVFRTQNSAQNLLKVRPAGAAPKKKPAQPAAPVKRVPKNVELPGEEQPVKPAPAAEKPVEKKPEPEAVKPAEVKLPEPEVKKPEVQPAAPEQKPVEKKAEPEVKKTETKPAAPVAKPAEQPAAPAKEAPKPAAAAAPAAPERPAPRFVDMAKVREADKPIRRSSGSSYGQRNGQGGRSQRDGQRPGQGGQRPQGGYSRQGQGGPGGQRPQGGRPQGQDQTQRPSGPRPQRPAAGGGAPAPSFGTGMQKPGAKNKNAKTNQGNRFDKKNSDELRRPGVKVSNKDLQRPGKPEKKAPEEPQIKMITIPEKLTIKDLADAMKIQPATIIKKLFMQGKIVTLNQEIDYDTASDIAVEFDVLCEKEVQVNIIDELLKDSIEDPEESLQMRPPVVCVMGHVDHGKTSLLDAIRNTNVTAREAGGITQHIGAYMVEVNGRKITFLDTPGHEAFTAMRMRGAMSTDIAILVVAADDGVMPQTVEAINHAKAAGVEIIVAINKIDKPAANVERVKQELTEYGLVAEDWGGSNVFVPVSAKTGEGIEELLEMILLTADIKELKANYNRKARGLVIEAQLDKGKGPVATVLVQKGTLKVGDNIACGSCYGKIRAMMDEYGRRVKVATPSTPVEILGLNDVPDAGEVFLALDSEKDARSYAETFIAEGKKKLLDDTKTRLSLDDLFDQIKEGNLKQLELIVKADVQGSVEAVKQSLLKLSNEEVLVKVIHDGAGNINESDVSLAAASNAIIIGFNVKVDPLAKSTADREKVDIRLYKVIYQAIEDVEAAMKGMLDPVFEEKIIGHAVVRQIFKASAIGSIAGSFILDGVITRGCKCRIFRKDERTGKDEQIFDGQLASLKRFKDDVKEVREGYECGLVFEKFNDLLEDDTIEAYEMVEVSRA